MAQIRNCGEARCRIQEEDQNIKEEVINFWDS